MKVFIGVVVVLVIVIAAVLVFSPKPSEDVDRAEVRDVEVVAESEGAPTEMEGEMIEEDESEVVTMTELDIAPSDITFEFIGYGPGKSHTGTFTDISVSNVKLDTSDVNAVPTSGTITFVTSSVKTDSSGLDGHLCAEEFFDCVTYPRITFDIVSVEKQSVTDYLITGNLEVKGVTKQITVPASYAKGFAQSTFVVDMSQFNFGKTGVNDEVEISISASLI